MRWGVLLIASCMAATGMAKGKSKGKSGAKVRYPVVESIQGKVDLVDDVLTVVNREPKHSEKLKPVKKGLGFKDKAFLRSEDKSNLRLQLSGSSTLVLDENTEVRLPAIDWKDGSVKEVHLLKGSVRYICTSDCNRKFVLPLYEGIPPVGDYLIKYDPKVPQVEMSVLSGEMAFRGLENESSVVLHAGEKATFTGMLDNDQPAFDVLLHGRKVAKGKLGEIQKLPADLTQKIQKQDEERAKALKKAAKPKRLPSQICEKPWGELNQCAWVCEKNRKGAKDCLVNQGAQCVRMRCNANGEWSDRAELPASQSPCKVESFVGTCDY